MRELEIEVRRLTEKVGRISVERDEARAQLANMQEGWEAWVDERFGKNRLRQGKWREKE